MRCGGARNGVRLESRIVNVTQERQAQGQQLFTRAPKHTVVATRLRFVVRHDDKFRSNEVGKDQKWHRILLLEEESACGTFNKRVRSRPEQTGKIPLTDSTYSLKQKRRKDVPGDSRGLV